jgi:hypothetical protein
VTRATGWGTQWIWSVGWPYYLALMVRRRRSLRRSSTYCGIREHVILCVGLGIDSMGERFKLWQNLASKVTVGIARLFPEYWSLAPRRGVCHAGSGFSLFFFFFFPFFGSAKREAQCSFLAVQYPWDAMEKSAIAVRRKDQSWLHSVDPPRMRR